jgi:broad specificity phosphatase PhoE
MLSSEVILIRHAEVAPEWKKICYGSLDVPLSEYGMMASQQYALRWENTDLSTIVYHSGLTRTETLARMISERLCSGESIADLRLRERNYGEWQGKTWDEAYASDPDHFHDLIDQPDTYRPAEGETTTEMQQRVVHWYEQVVSQASHHRIIVISHSGPIAALAGHLLGLPANQWQPWTIKNLESICILNQGGTTTVKRKILPPSAE